MRGSKARKIKYSVGDVFVIPSSVDGFYLGQIALDAKEEIGAPFCFIYCRSVSDKGCRHDYELSSSEVIGASLITSELIEHQGWKICANKPVPEHPALGSVEALRQRDFVGATVTGGGLVADFLDTYYGLMDRSRWAMPECVDNFFLNSGNQ